jgi:hypothetical protein
MDLYTQLVTEDFLLGVPEFLRVKDWTLDDNIALQSMMERRGKTSDSYKQLQKGLKTGKLAEHEFCRATPFVDNTHGQKCETDCIHRATGITAEIKFDNVAIYSQKNLTSSFTKRFVEIELMRDMRRGTARPGSLFIALCKNPKTLFVKLVAEYEYSTEEERKQNHNRPTNYKWRVYKGMELLQHVFGVIARDEMYADVCHNHQLYRRMVKLPVADLHHLEIPIAEITEEWLHDWLHA